MRGRSAILRRVSGGHYCFRSAAIQRHLSSLAGGAARSDAGGRRPPGCVGRAHRGLSSRSGLGKWETCFWFSTFADRFAELWECGNLARLLARFPRGSWEVWEACFWLSTLSTAPPFPQLPLHFRRRDAYFTVLRFVVVGRLASAGISSFAALPAHRFCYRARTSCNATGDTASGHQT
jgi:hypothetical protein